MSLPPFALERYFAPREFAARHLLCSSDCESRTISELLSMVPGAAEDLAQCTLGYTETRGHPQLRQAITSTYSSITPDDVLVHTGAQEAIFTLLSGVLSAGDHVVVHTPGYQSLSEVPRSLGCTVTHWQADAADRWSLDPDDLAHFLQRRTRLVIVNSPHNPTGFHLSRDAYDRIIELCDLHGVLLLVDEVYRGLEREPGARLPAACDAYEHGISLGVLSKAYGLAGLRIGWLASRNAEVLNAAAAMKDYTTICNSAPSEVLATTALRVGDRLLAENVALVNANASRFEDFVREHPEVFSLVPAVAGPTAFPRLELGEAADGFCERLLDATGVLLLPGSVFDPSCAQHVRVGFGRRSFPEALGVLEDYVHGASLAR